MSTNMKGSDVITFTKDFNYEYYSYIQDKLDSIAVIMLSHHV